MYVYSEPVNTGVDGSAIVENVLEKKSADVVVWALLPIAARQRVHSVIGSISVFSGLATDTLFGRIDVRYRAKKNKGRQSHEIKERVNFNAALFEQPASNT